MPLISKKNKDKLVAGIIAVSITGLLIWLKSDNKESKQLQPQKLVVNTLSDSARQTDNSNDVTAKVNDNHGNITYDFSRDKKVTVTTRLQPIGTKKHYETSVPLDAIKKESAIPHIAFNAPISNSPMQFAKGSTQNIYYGLKPRDVTEDIIDSVKKHVPNLKEGMSIWRMSNDVESLEFANKILKALNDIGYKNVVINGISFGGQIIGDPQAESERLKTIKYSSELGEFGITLPKNH